MVFLQSVQWFEWTDVMDSLFSECNIVLIGLVVRFYNRAHISSKILCFNDVYFYPVLFISDFQ